MKLRSLALAGLIFAGAAALPGRARAQANVTFSGGMGAPVILTLNAPVTYSITTASAGNYLFFVLQGTGNFLPSGANVNSTIAFTVNNGAPLTLQAIATGSTFGSTVTPTDTYTYRATNITLAIGDTVRLLTGTLTTQGNVAVAPPASGAYQTFLTGGGIGTKLDAVNGVSVAPEPSTWALVGLGVAGLGMTLRRRRVRLV